MKAITAFSEVELQLAEFEEPGLLQFNVPYYLCGKCKAGIYDARALLMEAVAVAWARGDDEESTMH